MVTPETFGRISRTVKLALNDEFCVFTQSRGRAGTLPYIFDSIIREDTLGDALNRAFGLYRLVTEDIEFALGAMRRSRPSSSPWRGRDWTGIISWPSGG